jgi:hypothetical protein
MDHHRESPTVPESECPPVTDFWDLVDYICNRHGISSLGSPKPAPDAQPER